MNEATDGPETADNLSPLEPRSTLSIPELKSAANYATGKYGKEPEFILTQDLERRHTLEIFEAVSRGDLTKEDAAELNGARMGELRVASDIDFLTSIYNRGGGQRRLTETLYLATRNNPPQRTTVLMLDLDDFSEVNELGHNAGDRALQAVGGHLSTTVRGSDIPFRYGGDEFGIILPNTGSDNARVIAKKLTEGAPVAVESALEAFGYKLPKQVTYSLGLAEHNSARRDAKPIGKTANDLLILADKALLVAKYLGKNRAVVARDAEGIITYTDLSSGKTYSVEFDKDNKITRAEVIQHG